MIVNSLGRHFKLPLTSWYPGDVPEPDRSAISINCKGLADEEIIRMAVSNTYNIDEDNINLRFNPSDFEKLRGDYRIRREFGAFTVSISGGSKQIRKKLEQIGFNIL
jgi:erythronate-4-phosphate dehydrogenase